MPKTGKCMKGAVMDISSEIRSYIVREGFSMKQILERLAVTHRWSGSLSNFSGKLKRGTLRYTEAKEIADILGYDIVWIRKRGGTGI